jgi:hypothetical protein
VTHSDAAIVIDDENPSTIRVIPGSPVAELSPVGIPMVTLIDSGTMGILNLGARWWPGESEIVAARTAVSARLDRPAAELAVTADAVSVEQVELVVAAAGGGDPLVLAKTASSGTPPFTALLSVTIAGGHLDLARRACLGEPGLLFVRYTATLRRGVEATTVLTARSWSGDTRDVSTLVAAGLVERTRYATAGAGPDVVAAADRLAEQRFAAAAAGPTSGGTVQVVATARLPAETALVREADVGNWLRGSSGGHVVRQADVGDASSSPPDEAASETVALGFDATGAPIESIEVGGATLTPPFAPVVVVRPADELTVTTRFPDGGSSLRSTVHRGPRGWTLTPADVGLVRVTVDASALRGSGARSIAVTAYYQPSDRGTPDTRTVELGPPEWRTGWFVVSRSAELAGELRLRLGAVDPPVAVSLPPLVTSTSPEVRLQTSPGG